MAESFFCPTYKREFEGGKPGAKVDQEPQQSWLRKVVGLE